MQLDIIGVPIDLGADRRGVDMGPSAIRYAHLQKELEALGFDVRDTGNIETAIAETCRITEPNLKYIDCIVPMARRAAGAVASALEAGRFPLVLGGDHSLALGSIHGAARVRKLGVLWVDAHADFNTAATTPSGNIHGMPLSALCGLGDERLTHLWPDRPVSLDPSRVAVIGARDLDPGEKDNLRQTGVMVQSMEQLDRYGLVNVMESTLAHITKEVDGIYLSFDMDALDPRHASGVGTPVTGGLTYREAHLICEMVAETGKLLGMDMVEVNPILDIQNSTARLAEELIASALGKRIWA